MICSKPLNMTKLLNDCESTNHDIIERVEECYKILLDAGSDHLAIVTIKNEMGTWQESAFTGELMFGTLVSCSHYDSAFAKQLIVNRRN